MKKMTVLIACIAILSACGPQEFQGKNPKDAKIEIENKVVTITVSMATPYFWLEKVNDESVEISQLYFKFDEDGESYLIKTDLEDWKPVSLDKPLDIGKVHITAGEKIVITYPSGTWAFP